jgi:putative ABC transport system permease protein
MRLDQDVSESFRIAWVALFANKGRGVLTALGIIIGIIAVITTMTAANGLQNTFRETFSAVGSDVIYVSQRPWVQMGPDFEFNKRASISLQSADMLAERLRGRAFVNPSTGTSKNVKYLSNVMDQVRIAGTTEKQVVVSDSSPEFGRFLMPFDVATKRNVAVIGSEVAEGLFGTQPAIGNRIIIDRTYFSVIGVMEKQGGGTFFGGPNFDRQIYIPITTFGKVFGNVGRRSNLDIAIKAPSTESMKSFEYDVIGEMRKIRGLKPKQDDDFSINKLDTLMGAYNSLMGVVVAVGLGVTGISLFVGGIGVMNIMFVSVTERTKEIGIRKALGAKRRSILLQFLFESSIICLFGGLVGVIVAGLLTLLINAVLMPASLSPFIVLLALVISLTVGVVSGFVPAYRGAKLDPIEALRYE